MYDEREAVNGSIKSEVRGLDMRMIQPKEEHQDINQNPWHSGDCMRCGYSHPRLPNSVRTKILQEFGRARLGDF